MLFVTVYSTQGIKTWSFRLKAQLTSITDTKTIFFRSNPTLFFPYTHTLLWEEDGNIESQRVYIKGLQEMIGCDAVFQACRNPFRKILSDWNELFSWIFWYTEGILLTKRLWLIFLMVKKKMQAFYFFKLECMNHLVDVLLVGYAA